MAEKGPAVPCSLIVTELLMNSLRHAFPGNWRGEIRTGFKITDGNCVLDYNDNGIGFSEGLDPRRTGTGGLYIVQGLVRQLQGTLKFQTHPGTRYQIPFPAESDREVNV